MKKRSVFVLTVSRARLLLGAAACLFLLLGLFWHNTSAAPHQIPHVVATINDTDDDQLRERVELLAKQYNANPIDAKKDPVWKAIPGLNGIRVDVERTIKQAKQAGAGSDKIPLAVDQLPPNVSLDQLGALPIYRGNPEKKQIALMINVAWGTEFLPDMLDTLDKYHAHATFFLDGDWAMQNKKLAREIVKRGHEIGSHGYKHPDMSKLGKKAQINQINRTNSMIKQAAGVDANLFAPPGGAYNGTTVEVAHSFKMRTILWTLDTLDWRKPPAATITDKVLQKAGNGTLVLMHPTAPTREALRTLLPALQQKGYGLVTVSELLDPTRPLPSS